MVVRSSWPHRLYSGIVHGGTNPTLAKNMTTHIRVAFFC